jgi:hypothetical protein
MYALALPAVYHYPLIDFLSEMEPLLGFDDDSLGTLLARLFAAHLA